MGTKANAVRAELADCENTLLRDIADLTMKRKQIAQTYALAMRSSEEINWGRVNTAIILRWSASGLAWIKRQAHSGRCFADEPTD
jgi:hypothetical protein